MIKKLFYITSTIQPRDAELTYSKTRSVFTTEERFRQTIGSITSIHNADPNAQIILLDSSDECEELLSKFNFIPNLTVIPLNKLDSGITDTVNSHRNKTLCECLMTNTFFKHYKKYIKDFDYVVKLSGRYNIFNFTNYFTEENKTKLFFKRPLSFKWNDDWRYNFIDLRHAQGNDQLMQYCTVLFAFGAQNLEKIMDMNDSIIHFLEQPSMNHYDMETLYYYLTRPFQSNIIETDWRVCGWDGTSGRFMYY